VKLRIDNLEFDYPGIPVLTDVTSTIKPGMLVAVTGTNGAGKSTFIKCLNRILEPRGTIYLDGSDLNSFSRKGIAKRMAYLSQKFSHAFPVNVFDVVLTGRFPHREWCQKRAVDEAKVSEVLDMLHLTPLAFREFNQLSGGQQQKVLIARAIVQEADVLLLDEPVSSLDIRHQLEVMDMAEKLAHNHGKSVVIAIHDLNLASRYADKVIMLHKGSVYCEGAPQDVLTAQVIEQVYGVTVDIHKNGGRPMIIPLTPLPTG